MAAHSCNICHDGFVSLSDVVLHTRARHRKDDAPLRCYLKECDEKIEISELTKHIRQRHPEQCSIVCRLCLQKFLFQFDYRNHARRIHGQNLRTRQIKCPTCRESVPDYTADHHRLVECPNHVENKPGYQRRAKARPSDLLGETLGSLDDFTAMHVLPSEEYNEKCRNIVNEVVTFLKSKEVPWNISNIKEGGSFGKGTSLKDHIDVSLVVLITDFHNMEDHIKKMQETLEQAKQSFIESNSWKDRISDVKVTCKSLNLSISVDDNSNLDVTIYPSCKTLQDNARRDEKRRLYRKMLNVKDDDRLMYNTTLTGFEVAFVHRRHSPIKKLIQLVKYWCHECFDAERISKMGRSAPSQYLLELVTIRSWEEAGQPDEFQLGLGFRAVLEKLVDNRSMFIVWHEHYDKATARESMRKFAMRRPIVLNPTDPTHNVAADCNTWREVASIAQDTLNKYLFKSWV